MLHEVFESGHMCSVLMAYHEALEGRPFCYIEIFCVFITLLHLIPIQRFTLQKVISLFCHGAENRSNLEMPASTVQKCASCKQGNFQKKKKLFQITLFWILSKFRQSFWRRNYPTPSRKRCTNPFGLTLSPCP